MAGLLFTPPAAFSHVTHPPQPTRCTGTIQVPGAWEAQGYGSATAQMLHQVVTGDNARGTYLTFRLISHHFDRFELDLRGHRHAVHVRGAALSCLRLKWADIVLI